VPGAFGASQASSARKSDGSTSPSDPHRRGDDKIEELLDVAYVPVFFLDEHQVVRPGEMGTVADIKAAAKRGIPCSVVPLNSQFSCSGSDAYLRWVVRLLDLEPGGPVVWEPDDRMRLLVADSPQEMEAFLEARRFQGYGARMSAGYCWRWSPEPRPGDPLPPDVVIGDWARPCNLRGDRAVSGAPPAVLWATDPAGFGQVGCVYTAQGFEYDWSGVIIGPDLVWRGGRWITDRTASKDPGLQEVQPGRRRGPPDPQHLQGPADPGHGGHDRVLDGPGDEGEAAGARGWTGTGSRARLTGRTPGR
jgi:uncharacterized protein